MSSIPRNRRVLSDKTHGASKDSNCELRVVGCSSKRAQWHESRSIGGTVVNAEMVIKKVLVLLSVGVFLPYAGLILDAIWPGQSIFARSGALMVACSISLVYYNHFIVREEKVTEDIFDILSRLPRDAQFVLDSNIDSLEKSTQVALRDGKLGELVERRQKIKASAAALQNISREVVRAEFLIGVFGTVIWGLGDVTLFKILSLAFLLFFVSPVVWAAVKHVRQVRLSTVS